MTNKAHQFLKEHHHEHDLTHDVHANLFPITAALYWMDVKGFPDEYRPAYGISGIEHEEDDVQELCDEFADWSKDELDDLSKHVELMWDEATRREDER